MLLKKMAISPVDFEVTCHYGAVHKLCHGREGWRAGELWSV